MKIFIIIIITIFIVLAIAYFMIGNYFYNMALNPNTSKEFVLGVIQDTQEQQEDENAKDVYITSTNNGKLRLHAYEVESKEPSNIWVMVVHGYYGKAKDMGYFVKQYYDRGYNVLAVDLRGHGKSEGNYIGMGWHDRLDIVDWVNYLIGKNSNCQIILHGISMGAATVMMATGENLPLNVKVAIEDCGYSSIWEEFEEQLYVLFNLPPFPVLNAASAVCKIRAGYMLEEGSAIEQVRKSKTPTLFIHGDEDKFVPFEMLDKVYEAANCEKQKLIIESAAHAEASIVNPTLYWKTIDEFIAKK